MRYRLYREHKYVIYMLTEFARLVAKTNFTNNIECENLEKEFAILHALMTGHASFEDQAIHELLRKKGSTIHKEIEEEHQEQEKQLKEFSQKLENIKNLKENDEQRIFLGHKFYLDYRDFLSENLSHLNEEETMVMSELQKLYTDEELKKIDANTYSIMTSEQMIHMMEILFPHMNKDDKLFFLKDIKDSEPEKFYLAFKGIETSLLDEEKEEFAENLKVNLNFSNKKNYSENINS